MLLKNETQCESQSWRPKEAIGLLQMATSDSPSSNHATCRVSTESWLHLVSVLGAPPPCRGAGTLCVRGTAEAGEAYLEPTELGGPQSRGARSWSPPPPTCHAPCQLCPHCPGSLASETTPLDGPGQHGARPEPCQRPYAAHALWARRALPLPSRPWAQVRCFFLLRPQCPAQRWLKKAFACVLKDRVLGPTSTWSQTHSHFWVPTPPRIPTISIKVTFGSDGRARSLFEARWKM